LAEDLTADTSHFQFLKHSSSKCKRQICIKKAMAGPLKVFYKAQILRWHSR